MDPAIVLRTVVLVLIAYLMGSIPMGVVVARVSGGTDPRTTNGYCYPSPEIRPLYPYIKRSQVFRCPADKGQHL